MSIQFRAARLCLTLLMAGVLIAPARAATPSPANAASDGASAQAQTKPAKAKAKKKSSKTNTVKYEKGSAESTSERDRRLFRECKGRPNAGACQGYAS